MSTLVGTQQQIQINTFVLLLPKQTVAGQPPQTCMLQPAFSTEPLVMHLWLLRRQDTTMHPPGTYIDHRLNRKQARRTVVSLTKNEAE